MNRLLVLRLSALGDVIHTIPAVRLLGEALPEAKIIWAVEEPYRELVELAGGAAALPLRLKKWSKSPVASREAMREALRNLRGASVSVDFQGLLKSAFLGRLSGAAMRFGFDADAIRERPALLFLNRAAKVDVARHVVEQNLELGLAVIRALGGNAEAAIPGPDSLPAWAASFADDPGGRLHEFRDAVVLLPGAGQDRKLWPVARFRELANRIGPRVLTVWGPAERDLAEAIGARMAPPTGLRELAWLLRRASLVIGADTGPLHLAAALGTRVIGLYGPTDPRRNGPWGQLSRCVSVFGSAKSMDAISVDEVMSRIERLEVE